MMQWHMSSRAYRERRGFAGAQHSRRRRCRSASTDQKTHRCPVERRRVRIGGDRTRARAAADEAVPREPQRRTEDDEDDESHAAFEPSGAGRVRGSTAPQPRPHIPVPHEPAPQALGPTASEPPPAPPTANASRTRAPRNPCRTFAVRVSRCFTTPACHAIARKKARWHPNC
jgi:hypothetical protein